MSYQIITSLADNDAYKFSMGQAVYHNSTDVEVEYEFICRTKDINLSTYIDEIKEEINNLCTLRFTEEELIGLKKLWPFIDDNFISYLFVGNRYWWNC